MSQQQVTLTLRYLRESARYTQAELARELGVARMTIMRWEGGETVPDGWQVRELARVLRVAPQHVIDALPEKVA